MRVSILQADYSIKIVDFDMRVFFFIIKLESQSYMFDLEKGTFSKKIVYILQLLTVEYNNKSVN